jgi:DNA-binding NarL/FixJ family response regulator
MALSVLVVEDDSFTRATTASALTQEGFSTPEPAHDFASAMASFKKHSHNVLLTDLDLGPGPGGIDLANMLRKLAPNLGVVVLSSYVDPRLHRANDPWLPGGAKYLVKQSLVTVHQITQAILDAAMAAARNERRVEKTALPGFTDTQIVTMQLLAKGLSNLEISRQRGVSDKAVEKSIRLIANQFELAPDSTIHLRVSIARAYQALIGGKI